jgi:hypothetical protein
VGTGSYSIEQIRVDQNVIWESGSYTGTYPEIEIQIVNPGDAVTLFPSDVVSSADVQSIQLLGTNQVGYAMSGPFVVCPSGTQVNAIAIDISLPAGLYNVNQNSQIESMPCDFHFQAQPIDDFGAPTGAWADLVVENLFLQDTNPIRTSYRVPVTLGRYQVQGQRTNAQNGTHASDQLYWVSLRAFVPNAAVYPDVTLIAVRATATINLNGSSAQKFNVVATRVLPVWSAGVWSAPVATRLPGPAACYLLKTIGGLPDSRIDLAALDALDAT